MPPRRSIPKGDASNPAPADAATTATAAAVHETEPLPQKHSLTVPLPDQPGACNFIVEFPGYIKNEDRALATFGGLDGLAAQRQTHPKTLQLRLRPGDPSCHPLISDDAKSTTVLVVKLTRSVNKHPAAAKSTPNNNINVNENKMQTDSDEEMNTQDDDDDDEDTNGVKAEIVAVADKTYAFSAPADFQYTGQDRRPYEVQWVARSDRIEDDPEFYPKQPLLCTPSMFAVEPAVDYAFKQYKAADHGLDVLGRKPKRGMGITWVDYFATAVPTADTKTLGTSSGGVGGAIHSAGADNNTNNAAPTGGSGGGGPRASIESLIARLELLFSRRPVYLESALGLALGKLDLSTSGGTINTSATTAPSSSFPATRSQQELLSKLCYRFKNGPWKGTWVLRGYDPRAEPAARQYQVLEYSLPVEWWKKVLTHKNKVNRQLQQLQLHNINTNNRTTLNTPTTTSTTTTAPGLPPVAASYSALCSFSGVQSTQTLQLQLCDIDDSEIRSVLAETTNVASGVNDGSGWLTQPAWEGIKTKVAARFGALWEAAATHTAAAANYRGSTTSGNNKSSSIGIIPPELMSELASYLEKGHHHHHSKTTAAGAGAGGRGRGAAESTAADVEGKEHQSGSGGGNAAVSIENIEAVEEDEEEEEEEEVELEVEEDDDEDDEDVGE
jgi:Tau95 Triple barrel domain/RNA polymerase III transcription factor (TF)IIIC subunit HTH domain